MFAFFLYFAEELNEKMNKNFKFYMNLKKAVISICLRYLSFVKIQLELERCELVARSNGCLALEN